MATPPPHPPESIRPEHLYKAVGLLLLVLFVYAHLEGIAQVLLIVYAAAILGVAFNVVVGLLPEHRGWVSAALGVAIFGGIAVGLWLGVPALANQVRGLTGEIPTYQAQLEAWAREVEDLTGLNVDLFGSQTRAFFSRIFSDSQMFGTARGVIEGIFLPFVLIMGGLFAAAKPNDRLLNPLLRIVPADRRESFRQVLHILGHRLRAWVKGTLLGMTIVGVLTTTGLWLLGSPYPLVLGMIASLAEIVPIMGPWVAGAIAVGVTFVQDPGAAVWVALLMLAIQQVESNLITPMVMATVAEVHPFVTLFAIVLFATLFGFLGILLAIPLVLLIWTLMEVLWVGRAIGTTADRIEPVVPD